MTWKCFPRHKSFIRIIHWLLIDYHHTRPETRSFWILWKVLWHHYYACPSWMFFIRSGGCIPFTFFNFPSQYQLHNSVNVYVSLSPSPSPSPPPIPHPHPHPHPHPSIHLSAYLSIHLSIYIWMDVSLSSLSRTFYENTRLNSLPCNSFFVGLKFPNMIFCRGVIDFLTGCPPGIWCRGLTICPVLVGPVFAKSTLKVGL